MTVTKEPKTVALEPKVIKPTAPPPTSQKLVLNEKAATKTKGSAKKPAEVVTTRGKTITAVAKHKGKKREADDNDDGDEQLTGSGPHFQPTSTAAKTKSKAAKSKEPLAKKVAAPVEKPVSTKMKSKQTHTEALAPPAQKAAAKSEKASSAKNVTTQKNTPSTTKVPSNKAVKTYKGTAAATLVNSAKADAATKAAMKQLLDESPVVPSSRKRARAADKENEVAVKPMTKKVSAAPLSNGTRVLANNAEVRVKSEPSELIITATHQEPSSSAHKARKKLRAAAVDAASEQGFSDQNENSGDESSVAPSSLARRRMKLKGKLKSCWLRCCVAELAPHGVVCVIHSTAAASDSESQKPKKQRRLVKAANAILLLSQLGNIEATLSDTAEEDNGFAYSTPPPQGELLYW